MRNSKGLSFHELSQLYAEGWDPNEGKRDKELLFKESNVLDLPEIVIMVNMALVLFVFDSGL